MNSPRRTRRGQDPEVPELRPDYESIDWTEIEQRFREGALRSKLMRLVATLTAIAMVLLLVNLIGVFWLRANVQDLTEHRIPLVDATRQAQLGMQRCLATLRGWVAMGDPRFKSERMHLWNTEIMPAVERIDDLLHAEGDGGSTAEFADLIGQLEDLRESQWWVADVAQTAGNEPARVEYEVHVLPIRRIMESSLHEIAEIAAQPNGSGDEAMGYLSQVALHLGACEAALQETIEHGRGASVRNFELSIAAAENSILELLANRPSLTPLQIEHVNAVNDELGWYAKRARAAIELRQALDWNVAQSLMEQETVPLTIELTARLDALAVEQSEMMRRDSDFASMASNVTVILSVILLGLMAGIAIALGNRRAEQITRPVQYLSDAATALAKGQLTENVPVMTDDELGRLTVVFNHMRLSLQRSEAALRQTNERMRSELQSAASYVESVLPLRLREGDRGVGTDWTFIASAELGGDSFGYDWIDDEHLAIYLLDVCGHGVGPAMLSMSAHNALRQRTLPDTDFVQPAQVLRALNRAFPMRENQNKFFTIWYGVYNTVTRRLDYGCGGHHAAILFNDGDSEPVELGMYNLIIGVLDDAEFESSSVSVAPGSRLYIFSDGLFEVRNPADAEMLELSGLARQLREAQSRSTDRLDTILAGIRRWQGADAFDDDYSLIELTFV